MLPIVLSLVGLFILLLVVLIATRPAEFRISRSAEIAAPPRAVFEHVNDFHAWEAWSPWAKLDPACKLRYEGPPSGVGAVYGWSGNSKVGQGQMTITDSKPGELVLIRLEFLRPFKCTNTAEFRFAPGGGRTKVTWSMLGRKNFLTKAFGLFCNMDKMVGGDFEKGLAQMKAIAERR